MTSRNGDSIKLARTATTTTRTEPTEPTEPTENMESNIEMPRFGNLVVHNGGVQLPTNMLSINDTEQR
jgi:hypothetical protein